MCEDIGYQKDLFRWVWNFDFLPKLKLAAILVRFNELQENTYQVHSQVCNIFLVYGVNEIAL